MKKHDNQRKEVIRVLKSKASKLPIGFIVGAAIGGGLYFYSTKNRSSKSSKSTNAITNMAKMVAPYVILAFLDKIVDYYEDGQCKINVEEVEAEVT